MEVITFIWGIQGKLHLDQAPDEGGGEDAAVHGLKMQFLQQKNNFFWGVK